MNYLPTGATVSSDRYRKTLTRLRRISSSYARESGQAKCCWSRTMRARIPFTKVVGPFLTSLGFTVLHHLSYSPDLAPSDYSLFDIIKDALRGEQFTSKSSGLLPMSVIATPQETCYVKLSKSSQWDKKMAAMYIRITRRGMYWASSCIVFSLKIMQLLQMRWVQIISERPTQIWIRIGSRPSWPNWYTILAFARRDRGKPQ